MDRLILWREHLRRRRTTNAAYRAVVGITGAIVLVAGIIAIPYPGPGWAIVFVGLAILASEFAWAHHTLRYSRRRYDAVMQWFAAQSLWLRAMGAVLTGIVVVGTLWLVGALGWSAGLVGVDEAWLRSPLGLGS
nr:TIGR02611 family protein [Mycolicibacterium palauense]